MKRHPAIKKILSLLYLSVTAGFLYAQVAKTQVLQLEAKETSTGIKLKWPSNPNKAGTYRVFSRDWNNPNGNWDVASDPLDANTNTFDIAIDEGTARKEFMVISVNTSNQTEALGYIHPANRFQQNLFGGQVILIIDSLISSSLPNEINTLKNDLISSGWFVDYFVVSRTDSPEKIKSQIKALYDKETFEKHALYILGHVPVPYSGNFSSSGDRFPPDGHTEGSGNHTGAWPADVYYSDLFGVWEDGLVSCTTGKSARHHNVPGDGKFDASGLPGESILETGRVDFFDMPAFAKDEIALTKEYLDRVHQWKSGEIKYINRALIDNNFNGLNLASSGYQNFPGLVGLDSTFDDRDYFKSQNDGNYLLSYGCGAGSYTSCNGIGKTTDFVKNKGSYNNIFTFLAGSYFGDWDSKNNLMRASLAAGSLACSWAGIPKWYVHHMGLGMNIGYGAMITQNNNQGYFNGSFNMSAKGIHIALLGDPTLTLHTVKPIQNLKATSQDGKVQLTWDKQDEADEYDVFRIDTLNHRIEWINGPSSTCNTIITDATFTDECNWSTGTYLYGVAAAKWVTTGSGSYKARALMEITNVNHTNNLDIHSANLSLYPNPTTGVLNIDHKSNDVEFRVFNTLGMSIHTGKTHNHKVNLSDLPDGVYRIELNDGFDVEKHTVIISK
ncbi:MAG: T9SS type A sorting domain-containing protein [Bacteroidia bacterium]